MKKNNITIWWWLTEWTANGDDKVYMCLPEVPQHIPYNRHLQACTYNVFRERCND